MSMDAEQVVKNLTVRQHAVLLLHDVHGELNEGLIAEHCWPLIAEGRGARMVAEGLKRKGLVVFGCWDDDIGYELELTDLGRAVLDKIVMRLLHERLSLLNKLKLEKD